MALEPRLAKAPLTAAELRVWEFLEQYAREAVACTHGRPKWHAPAAGPWDDLSLTQGRQSRQAAPYYIQARGTFPAVRAREAGGR